MRIFYYIIGLISTTLILVGGTLVYSMYKRPVETPLRGSQSVVAACTPQVDDAILNRINEERAKVGVGSVSVSRDIDIVSDDRAIRLNGTMDLHEGFKTLVSDGVFSSRYQTLGEVLSSSCDPVLSWMYSPKHKSIMLDSRYDEVGIGIYKNVFVVMFGDLVSL